MRTFLLSLFALCLAQLNSLGANLIYRGTMTTTATSKRGTEKVVHRVVLIYETIGRTIVGFKYRKPAPVSERFYFTVAAPETRVYSVGTPLKASTVIYNRFFEFDGGVDSFDRVLTGSNSEVKFKKGEAEVVIAPRILSGTETSQIFSDSAPGNSLLSRAKYTLRLDQAGTYAANEMNKGVGIVVAEEQQRLAAMGYAPNPP